MSITYIHRKPYVGNTFQKANELQVNKLAAARVRVRYLLERADTYLKDGSDVALEWAWDDLDEALYLLDAATYTTIQPKHSTKNQITDEMKQCALSYPICNLVSIVANKRAIAWCHDDNRPSLVHNTKHNKMWCPVCNKQFNPIDVIMHQEGLSYYNAIRRLCQ